MDKTFSTSRLIAQEAGLSASTVSLVLNNRADRVGIKPETQRRVLEIARRHNYVPNPLAVGLKGGATKTIGLLWSLGGPHDSQKMVRSISQRAMKQGYATNICDHLSDPAMTAQQLMDLRRRRIDAVILQDGGRTMVRREPSAAEPPSIWEPLTADEEIRSKLEGFSAVVVVGACPGNDEPCDWIHHDRACAYEEAADYFIATGRKRLAVIAPPVRSNEKVFAFFNGARKHGIELSEQSYIKLNVKPDEPLSNMYRQALDECLETHGSSPAGQFPFDGVMCSTDEGAAVVVNWLRERGLNVPWDVGVIGFNGSEWAGLMSPPLASVDRRDAEVAALASQMIFERLNNPQLPPRRRTIRMRMIWRESAGARPVEMAAINRNRGTK